MGNSQEHKQKEIFDNQYRKYSTYRLENWRISYLKMIFEGLEIKTGDRFLDIGVGGSGYTVIEAARRGLTAWGTDISPEGINKAQAFAKETLDNDRLKHCKFTLASAERLPFENNSFSKVCSIAVLEHISDDIKAIDEISRVTTRGGKIFICVPNCYETMPLMLSLLNKINDRMVGHLRHYNPQHLVTEFEKRGFVLESVIYHAHTIKMLQWMLSSIIPSLKYADSGLWWYFENLDIRRGANPKAMNFSIIMSKK